MATHSSMLAWEIPWTDKAGGLQSVGLQRDMTEHLSTCTYMGAEKQQNILVFKI